MKKLNYEREIMSKSKAPIYKEENIQTCNELLKSLVYSSEELHFACRANVPIKRGESRVGFGISESKKNIVCDTLIGIIREIKKTKGW